LVYAVLSCLLCPLSFALVLSSAQSIRLSNTLVDNLF
jgi:hypothetical protein